MTDTEKQEDVVEEETAAAAGSEDGEVEAALGEGEATDEAGENASRGATDDAGDEEDVFSEFVVSFADPISKSKPCGEDVKYDEDFETIKEEIDKLSENDFQLIVDLSTGLLKEKTKDVMVGSYLAFALTKQNGLSGFVDGIGVLTVLVDNFWEDLHPTRMPARSNALKFYAQRVAASLDGHKPSEAERSTVKKALLRLENFQAFVTEAMGDKAPPLSGVKKVLTDIERRLPKPVVKDTPTAGGGGDTRSGSAAAPAEIQSSADAANAVNKATAFLRNTDDKNPIPFRVLRALRWSAIVAPPPNENGKTKLPAPIEQRRMYLSSLLEQGDAKKLLQESEASFQEGTFHFWFDLQRLCTTGLTSLGPGYGNVRQAILEEMALLLMRVPELMDLTFADGTPFVSPLCSEWISAEVQPLLADGAGQTDSGVELDEDAPSLEQQKKEAMSLLNKGDLQGAISFMRKGGDQDKSAKDRFLRQLYLADLCMKGKRPSVARTILESLDVTIETHGLAEWEPDLALSAWSALHACYSALVAKAPGPEKANLAKSSGDIFDKICRIDAAYALMLPSG